MSSKTKIIVLRMKELIYTLIFAILVILLIVLLVFMFAPDKKNDAAETLSYQDGVYTASTELNDNSIDVAVIVDDNHIKSIDFVQLDETVATMYPLVQSSMESISKQIISTQSTENISYATDSQYTSMLLMEAIDSALAKAVE